MRFFRQLVNVKAASAFAVLVGFSFTVNTAVSQHRPRDTRTSSVRAIETLAAASYPNDRPGAAIIVVKDGRVIFRRGYGLANLELAVHIRPNSVFRLASVTKQFTAAAIMMLVEEGKLALDDDLTKFFPDYPTGGKKITIENLLTHTSGIPDYFGKIWPARIGEGFTPNGLIDLFKAEPLEFEPGTKEGYSNSNYVLLGAIIEKLSGQSYGQFVESRIFKPLGMNHSRYERNQEILPNRVSGYLKKDGIYINAAYLLMSQLYAAGGLDSTVDDLAKWDAAINSDRLLTHRSWERIFTRHKLGNGMDSPYALGWGIGKLQGHTIQIHEGGIPGFRTYVLRMPDEHLYIALLSNDETAEVQPEIIVHRIAAIAIGKPITESKVVQVDAASLDSFVGEYKDGDESLVIRREGMRLFAKGPEDPEVELFPTSGVDFVIKAFDGKITFVVDEHGKVTSLIESAGGQSGTLKKVK